MGVKICEKNSEREGSITIFLSLILLLILSLIMTIIEGARLSTARIFAERALLTAMDSVLAEFYDPLMEEYHLLGLNTGYGNNESEDNNILTKLDEYMSYTFEPNQGIRNHNDNLELYNISIDNIHMKERTNITDYQGEIFINEVVSYMKYKELGDSIELILDKLSLLEETKKVSYLYEEKHKLEKEILVIDEGILRLMCLMDGVMTDNKGLQVNKDGALRTLPDYIKKIQFGIISKEQVGINNEDIFIALKDSYVNTNDLFNRIEENFISFETTHIKTEELKQRITEAESSLIEAEKYLSELQGITPRTKALEKQIDNCMEGINSLVADKDALEKEKSGFEQRKLQLLEDIVLVKDKLSDTIHNIKPLLEEAIAVMEDIISATKQAEPLITQYEIKLSQEKGQLGDEIYRSLEEELSELKRYTLDNKAGYNFIQMKQVLQKNLQRIDTTIHIINQAEQSLGVSDYIGAKSSFHSAGEAILGYQTSELKLDYSTLVLSKSEKADPIGEILELLNEGMISLVLDPDTISNLKLTEEELPSDLEALATKEGTLHFTSLFSGMRIGSLNSGLGDLFAHMGNYNFSSMVGEVVEEIAEIVLFQEYLQEHFYSYTQDQTEINYRKPSSLQYEQEYLFIGKKTDKDNLETVIARVIFLRTLLNFTAILGNQTLRNEARLLATALVGFSGLPILVSITQTVILILLSFQEALVDTCALLIGKEVPILKKKTILGIHELGLLSRSNIRSKAATYKDQPKEISLSYQEILRIFLLFHNKKELSYRSMDLIQENIKIRYEDKFSINHCMFGFRAEAKFHIKPKFITVPILKDLLGSNNQDFIHLYETSYSY